MVAEALKTLTPGLRVEIRIIKTIGDKQQAWQERPAPLGSAGGKGIFVKEIEDALLAGEVDAAVHSLKDLPTELPEGLHVAVVPRREDPRDALVTRDGRDLDALPSGARVGTGSPRRVTQLRSRRPDLVFVPLRGNIDTRVGRVRGGDLDAVVLAMAGLNRLGLQGATAIPVSPEVCLPAPGQGALGLECRKEEGAFLGALAKLHDPDTAVCVLAERAFLAALGGGCLVPAGALASLEQRRLTLRCVVSDAEGTRLLRSTVSGDPSRPEDLGAGAASSLLAAGAAEILSHLRGGMGV